MCMLVTGGYENVKLTSVCRLHHYELVSVTVRNLFYPLDIARAAVYDVYLTIRSSVFCYENNQQDELYILIYYSKVGSTCFVRCFRPSSGARDFIYSIWVVFTQVAVGWYPYRTSADSNLGEHFPDTVNKVTCS
jgi:hypothetical protein